ncbi:MAG: hypothetical protein HOP18_03690 [Deltaproteobacteria bacterium]|nr:hypothetical protein [Deltaproteobacteria bacterium]
MNLSEKNLIASLSEGTLRDLSEDLIEQVIDGPITNDLIREIPIVKTIKAIIESGKNIREYFFAKKLCRFLLELREVSLEERIHMVKRLEEESDFEEKVGERLLHLIDRLDELSKAQLIGRAFRAYAHGDIGKQDLERLCFAIDRLILVDLRLIPEFLLKGRIQGRRVQQNLANAGLAFINSGLGGSWAEPVETCEVFVRYILLLDVQPRENSA